MIEAVEIASRVPQSLTKNVIRSFYEWPQQIQYSLIRSYLCTLIFSSKSSDDIGTKELL